MRSRQKGRSSDMPLYHYYCAECRKIREELRPIRFRNAPAQCCGRQMERVATAASLDTWKDDRRFPNLGTRGDNSRSFESKGKYEAFLKENNMVEAAIDGKLNRNHGATFRKVYGREATIS